MNINVNKGEYMNHDVTTLTQMIDEYTNRHYRNHQTVTT